MCAAVCAAVCVAVCVAAQTQNLYVLQVTYIRQKVNKEDELEKLERKLKIYIRKGKHGKAAKLRDKIQALLGTCVCMCALYAYLNCIHRV